MDKITHRHLTVNGIRMHVAEAGGGDDDDSPVVLFLHGFPEIWYTWRHQMLYLSARGYRAIAPDLRGYGETDAPPSSAEYTALHIIGDLVALLNALNLKQVFLVAHDWGAIIAWWLCLLRPDRVRALVNMSVQFHPRHPEIKFIQNYRNMLGDGFYMCRFQEEDVPEKTFESVGINKVLEAFYSLRLTEPLVVPKEVGLDLLFRQADGLDLPPWITPADVEYVADNIRRSGFTGGLNYYRAFDLSWELLAPWTAAKVDTPVKFIIGDLDLTYHVPGVKEYIHGGAFKSDVPNLAEVVVMEGVGHFLNQEKAEDVSRHVHEFIAKF